MTSYAIPILFVLFVWWFSTGVVIYLNNLPPRTFRWSVSVATVLLPFCVGGVYALRGSATGGAAYLSFTCGVAAWAWTQLTFYTGTLTGPRRTPCPSTCKGLRHFWHAIETSLHHEIVALALGALLFAASAGGANRCGAWTYALLWAMHSSAKVNAVLGIRNLNVEFFPPHLRYLRSFLKRRAINPLFPLSVTGGTIAAVILFENATQAASANGFLNAVFLGTMMALAVIEHWLLILPIKAQTLWAWGLSGRKQNSESQPPAKPTARLDLHEPVFAMESQ